MSRPRTVRAQITKIDTAMNTIAHNTAMITPTVRAQAAPLNAVASAAAGCERENEGSVANGDRTLILVVCG
ncbi:MAG: hypothetical protein WBN93_09840 [Acidimicrobiia bacterium]|jgi:hypothetical protein